MKSPTPVFLIQQQVYVPNFDTRRFVRLNVPAEATPEVVAEALADWCSDKKQTSLIFIVDSDAIEHSTLDNVANVSDRALRGHIRELTAENPIIGDSELVGWASTATWPNGAMRRVIIHHEARPYLRILVERLAAEHVVVRAAVSFWEIALRLVEGVDAAKTKKKTTNSTPALAVVVAERTIVWAIISPYARRTTGWFAPGAAESDVSAMLDELQGFGSAAATSGWSSSGVSTASRAHFHVMTLTDVDRGALVGFADRTHFRGDLDLDTLLPLLRRPFEGYANFLTDFPKTIDLTQPLRLVAAAGLVAALTFGFLGWQTSTRSVTQQATAGAQISVLESQLNEVKARKERIERIEKDFSVDTFTVPRGKPDALQALSRALPSAFTLSFLELSAENNWRVEGMILSSGKEATVRQAADQVRDALTASGFTPDPNGGFQFDIREAKIAASGKWSPRGATSIGLLDLVDDQAAATLKQNTEGTLRSGK